MAKPRRAWARVIYNGMDITDKITDSLLSISYTDNTDEADEIKLTFEDIGQNWIGDWFPKVAEKRGSS